MTETRSSQSDIVVFGGGLAGLTTACYLARAGVDVTVFEKASYAGGRAATRESDGFLFNRGGHALYTGGAGSRFLEELGVSYDYGIPKDTFVLQEGKLSPFPADPLGLLHTDFLDAGDKLALFRFFVAVSRAKPGALARTSVQEWLDGRVRRQQLRRVITAFARVRLQHGARPRQCGDVRREVSALTQAPHTLHRRRMAGAGRRAAGRGGARWGSRRE